MARTCLMPLTRFASTLFVVTTALALFSHPSPAVGQDDPIVLQKRARVRFDAYVDRFRRTGDRPNPSPDLAQADAELSTSNAALAARKTWSALAYGLITQGSVHRVQGEWERAIALYDQAVDAAGRARKTAYQSEALAWRSLAQSSRHNVGPAIKDAFEAVRLGESADDPNVLAHALDVLVTAQLQQGDMAGAASTVNRELEVASRTDKDSLASYAARQNRSDLYLKVSDQCESEPSFDVCNQALDRAQADVREALLIVRRLGYQGLAQMTAGFVQEIDQRRAILRMRIDAYREPLPDSGMFHPRKPSDVLVTQDFSVAALNPELVAGLYEANKREAEKAGPFADVTRVRALHVDGMMYQMRDRHDSALASFMKAVAIVEHDRSSLSDERSRGTYMEDWAGVFYAAMNELLQSHRFADAFDIVERVRSRGLADLLASRTLGLTRPAEQRLYAESALLRSQISQVQQTLWQALAGSAKHPTEGEGATRVRELEARIASLEAENRRVMARMAVQAPRLQELMTAKPGSLPALQASMRREHYEMLQYLVIAPNVIVWHISSDSVTVRKVFLPTAQLEAKVAALQNSLAARKSGFDTTTAQELYLYLVEPVRAHIHSDRLVIVPHETLQYVPFQVFRNPADGRYLGERYQLTYAPSASVLLQMKRPAGGAGGRLLAVADPGIDSGVDEVEAIAQEFPRHKVVLGTLASEHEVKAWAGDYDVIHLSVHGEFEAKEPMLSHLLLAPGAGDDGQLTAAEMFGLPFRGNPLVVLSACETGRVQATHGNEILGMVRALLYAGAGSLVLSNWEVEAGATALWMQTFYAAARSKPLPEAARVALTTVKARPEYAHPYYWSAFSVIGR
jgi:CHAT domain-containing protein